MTILGSFANRCRDDYGVASGSAQINERGQVVGSSDTDRRNPDGRCAHHGFLWEKGRMIDLGTLPGKLSDRDYPKESEAVAINDSGQVVGTGTIGAGNVNHAFLWQDGRMTDLGLGYAKGINNKGWVVGGMGCYATLWRGVSVVNVYTRGCPNIAGAVNERGQVLGYTALPSGVRAFVWRDGKATNLPLLGGSESWDRDLNNHGQAIGTSSVEMKRAGRCGPPPGEGEPWACMHAVLWTLKR